MAASPRSASRGERRLRRDRHAHPLPPDGGDIVIDGTKTFITNGDVADVYVLFGKWAEIEDGRAAITALVVEKEAAGISVLRLEDKLGLRASSTAALAFEGVRVPRKTWCSGRARG